MFVACSAYFVCLDFVILTDFIYLPKIENYEALHYALAHSYDIILITIISEAQSDFLNMVILLNYDIARLYVSTFS
jgi:hypothetical protein